MSGKQILPEPLPVKDTLQGVDRMKCLRCNGKRHICPDLLKPQTRLRCPDCNPYPEEEIGTPMSEMDGNASVANASGENRRKWDNWVAFSESWGR